MSTLTMIPIKIECGCGQRYSFDVAQGSGPVSFPVACPTCGTDGTAAANALIAQSNEPSAPLVIPAAPRVRLQIPTPVAPTQPAVAQVATVTAAPSPAPRRAPMPGQIAPAQAEIEARAKIFWGDPTEEVIKFMMIQGFSYAEANSAVQVMFQERVTTLRSIGLRKWMSGIGFMTVPVIAWLIFMSMGFLPVKIFAITVMVGVWGAWLFLRGLLMFLSPKSETCDVADQ